MASTFGLAYNGAHAPLYPSHNGVTHRRRRRQSSTHSRQRQHTLVLGRGRADDDARTLLLTYNTFADPVQKSAQHIYDNVHRTKHCRRKRLAVADAGRLEWGGPEFPALRAYMCSEIYASV